ncbi:fluoride efflux transporter CrcB [Rhodalgimonas zhirmunskyi]|uniref:Fluoride-specific ion channel FluC n=1 Tax=Rhodalgimonas zhirmunskyi TaxID=2964767 RepID=A0AAJ1X4T7_9RHOB|nr:fluoride efflux transporter CrcB [Rhodoalgimonas zhirmunskyi]MDQ2093861.1 fluoride efflux transporter CrcB [Rhodoalgimonas zhirmunskyi]
MTGTVFQVALGGAIGASARYLLGVTVGHWFGHHTFPMGVIVANILGSFLMGALIVYLGQKGLTHWNAFLATGVLGGFTTFSSFSLETWRLMDEGRYDLAGAYVGLSVVVAIAALIAGVHTMRTVLAA